MVQKIVKGKHIFARKAQPATEADKQVVTDFPFFSTLAKARVFFCATGYSWA